MSEITVPISIINDDIVELTESFNVSLVITDDDGINVTLIQNEAVVYILDNDSTYLRVYLYHCVCVCVCMFVSDVLERNLTKV